MRRGSLSIGEILVVSRPVWWIITSLLFVVGSMLETKQVNFTIIIGALYFMLPYNLLLHGVRDVYDYELESQAARRASQRKVYLSKLKHPALWRSIAVINLPFVAYLLIVGNLESNVFLFMMAFMILAFNVHGLRYKEIPFIDALTSAFQYTSPFLFGLFLFESPDLWAPVFAGIYFWSVGNYIFGDIQNISLKKRLGIKSTTTVLGVKKSINFTLLMYIIAAIAPALAYKQYGLLAAAAILPFFTTVISTKRHSNNDSAPAFRNSKTKLLILNYIVGIIASILLIYLYNK